MGIQVIWLSEFVSEFSMYLDSVVAPVVVALAPVVEGQVVVVASF